MSCNKLHSISTFYDDNIRWISKRAPIDIGLSDTIEYNLTIARFKYNLKNISRLSRGKLEETMLIKKVLPKGIHIKEIWDIPFGGEYRSETLSLTYENSFKDIKILH